MQTGGKGKNTWGTVLSPVQVYHWNKLLRDVGKKEGESLLWPLIHEVVNVLVRKKIWGFSAALFPSLPLSPPSSLTSCCSHLLLRRWWFVCLSNSRKTLFFGSWKVQQLLRAKGTWLHGLAIIHVSLCHKGWIACVFLMKFEVIQFLMALTWKASCLSQLINPRLALISRYSNTSTHL